MIDLMPCKKGVFAWRSQNLFEKIGYSHKNRAVNLHTNMKIAAKRNIPFIVALALIILNSSIQAQESPSIKGRGLPQSLVFKARPVAALEGGQGIFKPPAALFRPNPSEEGPGPASLKPGLPIDFYYQHLGFVCRMEWSFEKNSHLPIKFRLGSLEYVNFLEGKK
jgi:hypothetical protein